MANPNGGTNSKDTAPAEEKATTDKPEELTCGIIMPISAIDGCTADHWAEVKAIICEAVESIATPRFTPSLVSEANEVGVIQKRIVQNVYSSSIVVCDVSAKNPNVMFELGLRLAFDKPTVIVKDDKTDYSFDTGVIEHLPYPRDLRFAKIVDFKSRLAEKVANTYKASIEDPSHSPFLKSFGEFRVTSLTQIEVSPFELILGTLGEVQRDIQLLKYKSEAETTVRNFTSPSWAEAKLQSSPGIYIAGQIKEWCEFKGIDVQTLAPNEAAYSAVSEYTKEMYGFHVSPELVASVWQAALKQGYFRPKPIG